MTANEPGRAATPRLTADAWFTPGRFFLLLAGIIAARFAPVLLGRETFFYRDYGLFTYPIAHYYRDCFWRGEFPLWNPLNNFGVPLLAQWNAALLYPPALFYLLLPLTWALAVFNLAHLALAGMGMYFLARRWTGSQLAASVAAMAFAFNGLSLHMLMWVSNLAAWAWMPWVVLALERAWREGGRMVGWAALAGGVQMLSGAPELIILTWAFAGVLWLAQFCREKVSRGRMFGPMVLAVILTGGLAAAQLLPFLELLAHSQRDTSYGDSKWAMPGWGWANFFVPLFHCSPSIIGIFSQNEQQWTSSYYLGIGVVALAMLAAWQSRAARARWLAFAVVAGVVLAMGDNAHMYSWIKRAFPLLGVMRYPIKIVVLTVFALPLLAAFALKEDSAAPADARDASRRFLGVGIFVALIVAAILVYARRFPLPDETWLVTRESGVTRLVFLALILGLAWMVNQARAARTIGLAGAAMLLLIALDSLTHTANQNPTVPVAAYEPLGIGQTVRARYGESRALVHPRLQAFLYHGATSDALTFYLGLRRALYLDCNLIDGIPTGSGFFSLELRSAAPVTALLGSDTITFPEPLADFVGASQISAPDTSFTWTARTNFMPLATAGQKPAFVGRENAVRAMLSPDFNPRATVYLPLEARGAISVTNRSAAKISAREFSAQRAIFVVNSEAPAIVVVAQAFYEPWHAYVDGVRVKLWEANGAFQALEVPAGKHQVKLIYEDAAFHYGVMISLASLAVVAWKLKRPIKAARRA